MLAFTATQFPGIDDRRYSVELAGPQFPNGIPIEAESDLEALIRDRAVNSVMFACSDVSHAQVMHAASQRRPTRTYRGTGSAPRGAGGREWHHGRAATLECARGHHLRQSQLTTPSPNICSIRSALSENDSSTLRVCWP